MAKRGVAALFAAAVSLTLSAGVGASSATQASPPSPPAAGAALRAVTADDHVMPRRQSGSATTKRPSALAPSVGPSVGGTWSWQNPLPDGNFLNGVSCPTASSCIAVGGGGLILATTNGGSTWTQQSSGVTDSINGVSCPTASICYAAGDFGEIYKTTNGGASWSVQRTVLVFFAGISCPDAMTCYAAGGGGDVIRTVDGGATWAASSTPDPYNLFAISCSSTTSCAAVGANGAIVTTTNGTSWAVAANANNVLYGVSCTPNHCAAVGVGGIVEEYNGAFGSWAGAGNLGSTDLYAVSCPSDTSCIAVGALGTGLALVVPAGSPIETWVADNAPTQASLFGISCQASLACGVAGDYRTTGMTSAGGSGWSVQMDGLHIGMNAISCPGSLSVCYVAGEWGLVGKTTDRGATWTATSLGILRNFDAISCPSSTWCVAVGQNGLIEITHDAGATWTQEQSGTSSVLTSVSCPTTTACVVVGQNGTIVVTTDGGTTWQPRFVLSDDLFGVSCAPGTLTCVAVGDNESIFTTTDGFNNSRVVINNFMTRFQTVACPTTLICYVGGKAGMMLKTPDFFSNISNISQQIYASTAPIESVSCSSSTACAASAFGENSALTTIDGTSWTVTKVGSGLASVTCPVADCIAVSNLAVANLTAGVWSIQSDVLRGISCPTASACVAVGHSGLAYGTTDGGTTWTQRPAGLTAALESVSCPSASICFVAGPNEILSTTDQGVTWASHSTPTMNSISCATTTECVAVGDSGSVTHSTDGGTTWTSSIAISGSGSLRAVSCTSASACFAAADNGIYWTSDGGATWPGHFTPSQPVGSISCVASSCVAVGGAGTIVATANGGGTWTSKTSGTARALVAVSCPTATACIATGAGGAVLSSVDGGTTWKQQYAGADMLSSISCATANSCHAVDSNSREIVATSSGGVGAWSFHGPSGNTNSLRGISCASATACYAVGYPGTFLDTHDGGATWLDHSVTTSDFLFAVSCPSITTCFAAGFPGVIYKTTDSGVTWTSQPNPDSGNLNVALLGISCATTTTCVAVGATGNALSTSNGSTWIKESTGTMLHLWGVSCPTSTSCLAVGDFGLTLRRQGGSWSAGATAPNTLVGVSCDMSTCYAVGVLGIVVTTSTFGTAWTAQRSGVSFTLYGVSCVRSVCVAAGDSGEMVMTTDGTNWSFVDLHTQNFFRAISVPDLNHAFVVGLGGTILATSNLTPECGTSSVSADATSPIGVGTVVHWTATSTGCSSPMYEFFLQDPNGNWTLQQAFSLSNAWTWNTSGTAPGTYTVHAWANQSGDPTGTFESYGSGSMTLAPCGSTALTPASLTQPAGSMVNLTASSTGCPHPEYEFWVQYPDGSWNLKQVWGAAAFSWDTSGLATGTYLVHVWVNTSGTGHDSIGSAMVTLTGCTSASVSPPNPSAPAGSTVAFTASSSGCLNPRYEFWVQYPDGSWNLKQAWGGATFNWDTTGLAPGSYLVHAWVNRTGTTWEAYGSATVKLTGCTSASVSPSTVTQAAGSLVALTASSGGCANPVYEFWVQYPNGSWNLARGWGVAGFSWDTTGLAPGMYTVHAWANQQGAAPTLEVYGFSTVTLTGCATASLSPSNPSQGAGTTVALAAGSTGCPSPRYEFWVQYPSGTWYLKQGFGGASFIWDTTGLAPGVYVVHVWVNTQGTGHDAIGSATATLTGCTSATLMPSSGSGAAGTSVLFTASSAGCASPVYEFWLQYPDGSWHLMRTFSSTTSWTWDSTGFAKGTYTIHVWANNQGADTSTNETYGSATYSLT
jgi:photosystem II stability/assembly factor-like uncharacterized protein